MKISGGVWHNLLSRSYEWYRLPPHGEFAPPSSPPWTYPKLSILSSPVTFNGLKGLRHSILSYLTIDKITFRLKEIV